MATLLRDLPRRAWAAWTRAGGENTRSDVEGALGLLGAGLRIGLVLQMLPSLTTGVDASDAPRLYLVVWLVTAGFSTAVAGACLVGRRIPSGPGLALDLVVTVVVTLLGFVVVPVDDRIGTWSGFHGGLAMAVLLTTCAATRTWAWVLGVVVVIVANVALMAPLLDGPRAESVLSTLVTWIAVSAVARGAVLALRRVAQDADSARARAAELARADELRRARTAFHNGVALMRQLTDGPDEVDDAWRDELRWRARAEARRMRSYLRSGGDGRADAPSGTRSLATVLRGAARSFDDLAPELVVDLARDVQVGPEDAEALEAAVVSVLLNVRQHADAERVVVHADAVDDEWTVTVHDDGRGFDVETVPFGVGLDALVVGALNERGVRAVVESDVGLGTIVTMTRVRAEEQATR